MVWLNAMDSSLLFRFPVIEDEDIDWVCDLLSLPPTAFDDCRLNVLKSNSTIDIAACPGSGKTTLLVAKLAILARKWTDQRRGICVLSHTNVARQEIEHRLGNTEEGQRLLSYPHFIGTIHKFVNEFIALPGVRYEGIPVRAIDDDLCENHRRYLLQQHRFRALSTYVGHKEKQARNPVNVVKSWFVGSTSFDVTTYDGKPVFKDPATPSAMQLKQLAEEAVNDGYHRHDEMFTVWATNLIEKNPDLITALRTRFPIQFIDETQDNSELQSKLLNRVFIGGSASVIRQRFGDANQAIFNNSSQSDGATTDKFPNGSVENLPNSHRFGRCIAGFSNPVGLNPQGLIGQGPSNKSISTDTTGKHTIFLFDDHSRLSVLKAYGSYLADVFTEEELNLDARELASGGFTAIGAVHRRPENDKNKPWSVWDYWQEYAPQFSTSYKRLSTFCQYVMVGQESSELSRSSNSCVEKIAEGILHLAGLAAPDVSFANRKYRYILELIDGHQDIKAAYLDLIRQFAIDGEKLTETVWKDSWLPKLYELVKLLTCGTADFNKVGAFLDWNSGPITETELEAPAVKKRRFYNDPENSPKVQIRVGSIHSVKGETHIATLVLETFNRTHHLKKLKRWLLGNAGTAKQREADAARLKLHYVAMTRPSHLLCLAIPSSTFELEEVNTLKQQGWRIARVQPDGSFLW